MYQSKFSLVIRRGALFFIALILLTATSGLAGSRVWAGAVEAVNDPMNPPCVEYSDVPGEVRLCKTAKAVEGLVNTWDITLRVEARELKRTSDVVLVIDRSGSMRTAGRMRSAKTAAKLFVDKLLSDTSSQATRIGLVSFAAYATLDKNIGSSKNDLDAAIDSMRPFGGTFTQDGIRKATEMLADSTADQKHIVLLSDGEPTFGYGINSPLDIGKLDKYSVSWGTRDNLEKSDFSNYRMGNGYSVWAISGYFSNIDNRIIYLNHGNSAVAEANFAKKDNNKVWSVALAVGQNGQNILSRIATAPENYTSAEPNQLESVFSKIAGSIISPISDARIVDPMGDGFRVVGAVTPLQGDATYNELDGVLSWNIGDLTQSEIRDGKRVKYEELTYRVEITDKLRDVKKEGQTPSSTDLFPTNKDAQLTYKDHLGENREKLFPKPEVNPVLITVQKKVLTADKKPKNVNHDFKIDLKNDVARGICRSPQECPSQLTYDLNASNAESATKSRQTQLRLTGTYSVEELFEGNVTSEDYDVSYQVNGADSASFTVNNNNDPDISVVVTNTEKPINLTATKVWENVPENQRSDVKVVPERSTDGSDWAEVGEPKVIQRQNEESSVSWKLDRFAENGQRYQYRVKELTDLPHVSSKVECSPATEQTSGTIECTVTNTANPGSVSWAKVDAADSSDTFLGGSVWTLTAENQESTTVEDCIAENAEKCLGPDKDPEAGKFTVSDLAWGKWTLVETRAPFGYFLDSTPHEVTIGGETINASFGKIENTRIETPPLPLTGGISRDHFYVAGTLLFVLAAGVMRRNRRHAN
ncbi:VWA domain-containing protein [Arcanobacterium phocisimile]|uniref:VWA domain-containing protein n=1 Tax=Arcanobacterium phocisimile TaxID=1302235 RepID=A0ABX7IGV9_9ACTO|nr:vWA domain-containing protein [Arcanobacterium phocisimile]QRV02206.1 VWA domain-containing protein [Arcanobacterium phocisimile]